MTALQRMQQPVPPPPPQDHRSRRHSPKTMQLARAMYDGGWTPGQIRRYLADQGIPAPAETTLRGWLIPVERAAALEAARVANRRRRAVRARIIELHTEVKLLAPAITRLVRHDHGAMAAWVTVGAVRAIVAEHEASNA